MASSLVQPPVVKTKALFCPNCGGPVEIRGFGYALTVVCPQCLSVLDASTPLLKKLQQFEEAQRHIPDIPLGTRGKFGGVTWEVIGYQRRGVRGEFPYVWNEYLLFNPYKGFRYLTEYHGHWNFVTPLEAMPVRRAIGSRPAVVFNGRTFKHFSGAEAETGFVLGEFPWRVRVGETVVCDDFIDPPTVLSSETTQDEVTWSQGEYILGSEVWKAFSLPGSAPPPQGIFENQPSPYTGKGSGMWGLFGWMLLMLIVLAIFFGAFSRQNMVYYKRYHFAGGQKGEASFVTPEFELKGRPAALELAINTDLTNDWAYFNFGLINQDTGSAYDFGKEVSYYAGRDSDGSWSEGDRSSKVVIPTVPAGHYYLWVEPEMEDRGVHDVTYDLVVRHDVPTYVWFWLAALLLLIPPVWHTIRVRSFEATRWADSDYGG